MKQIKKIINKLSFFYRYSMLTRQGENPNNNNIVKYYYTGDIYSNEECTEKLGVLFMEQIVNIVNGSTISNLSVSLPEGVINLVLHNVTIDGKAIPSQISSGPVMYGMDRYMLWNSAKYFFVKKTYEDNNTYSMSIRKIIV